MPASLVTDHPGLSVFFSVILDVADLGTWTKVSGLGMKIATEARGDTAMTFFQHHLPSHVEYENIVLERPVSPDTQTVIDWISAYHMLPVPTAAEITCLDSNMQPLMAWGLLGVSPVSWRGPSFDANSPSLATEVLTVAHMGFMSA
jgi:phage tail-like protein